MVGSRVWCWLAVSVNKIPNVENSVAISSVCLVFLLALSLFIGALLLIAVFRYALPSNKRSDITLHYEVNSLGLTVSWGTRLFGQKPTSQSSTSKRRHTHPQATFTISFTFVSARSCFKHNQIMSMCSWMSLELK